MYDEAIPFLKKALEAKDYENYQFPHFNLGRIYIMKDMYREAREEFKKALEIEPNYHTAKLYLEILTQYLTRDI